MTLLPISIPDTEVHSLYSEAVKDNFELWIAKPQAGFAPVSAEPPKILYVLDANLCFGMPVEMTRLMHKLYGELPPILVVGIAYPTDDGFKQGMLRTRDFTPSTDGRFDEMAATLPQLPQAFQVEPPMGGAACFLRFLVDEVMPYVRDRFNFCESDSTLFGSSLGGLFVTYTLLTEPSAFNNFIAASPSLWWDNEMMFDLVAASDFEQVQNRFFIAVGELEESPDIPMLAQFKTVTNVQRMAEQLSHTNGSHLIVKSAILAGETHTSVIPVTLTKGLRSCLTS